jgi:hypothetical protein
MENIQAMIPANAHMPKAARGPAVPVRVQLPLSVQEQLSLRLYRLTQEIQTPTAKGAQETTKEET